MRGPRTWQAVAGEKLCEGRLGMAGCCFTSLARAPFVRTRCSLAWSSAFDRTLFVFEPSEMSISGSLEAQTRALTLMPGKVNWARISTSAWQARVRNRLIQVAGMLGCRKGVQTASNDLEILRGEARMGRGAGPLYALLCSARIGAHSASISSSGQNAPTNVAAAKAFWPVDLVQHGISACVGFFD